MISIKTTVRNGRIEVPAPNGLPDGTDVIVTIGASEPGEEEPMTPDEIARVLAGMKELEPLEIPEAVASDLDAWERRINDHGIDHKDPGIEAAFE